MMKSSYKTILLSILGTIIFIIPWIILYYFHTLDEEFIFDTYAVDFIVDVMFSAGCLITFIHLRSRINLIQGNYKKLYHYSSITFLLFLLMGIYRLVDMQMRWMDGVTNIMELENQIFPYLYYEFFHIPGFEVILSFNSTLSFILILISLAFYLYPMERYVTQVRDHPWHTYSILISAAVIPITLMFRPIPNFTILISIVTVSIQVLTLYNGGYLIYIYLITGIRAQEGSKIRIISFLVALGIILIVFFFIFRVGFLTMLPLFIGSSLSQGSTIVDIFSRIILGFIGLFLFNYGFYLIEFEKEEGTPS